VGVNGLGRALRRSRRYDVYAEISGRLLHVAFMLRRAAGRRRQHILEAALCAHLRGRHLAPLARAQRALERGAEFLVHALALLAGPPADLRVLRLRLLAAVGAGAAALAATVAVAGGVQGDASANQGGTTLAPGLGRTQGVVALSTAPARTSNLLWPRRGR
jgi:hypothetical protein